MVVEKKKLHETAGPSRSLGREKITGGERIDGDGEGREKPQVNQDGEAVSEVNRGDQTPSGTGAQKSRVDQGGVTDLQKQNGPINHPYLPARTPNRIAIH